VPDTVGRTRWECIPNDALLSFAEVKRLVVYPMLIAQFIGIVHEIKPEFLGPPIRNGFGSGGHIPPTLIALGTFSGNSKAIVEAFVRRKFQIHVAENYDMRLAQARKDQTRSPLFDTETDRGTLEP
jgi:hypothetical protein